MKNYILPTWGNYFNVTIIELLFFIFKNIFLGDSMLHPGPHPELPPRVHYQWGVLIFVGLVLLRRYFEKWFKMGYCLFNKGSLTKVLFGIVTIIFLMTFSLLNFNYWFITAGFFRILRLHFK